MTLASLQTSLDDVQMAISRLLKRGVSYSNVGGNRQFERLEALQKEREYLLSMIQRMQEGGSFGVTDLSGGRSAAVDNDWDLYDE
jgi:hypothetical protein